MHIGILGAGRMGSTLARLFVAAGHSVTMANSRAPSSLDELVRELGSRAAAGTLADLASQSDVVVLSTRWEQAPRALAALSPSLGKVIIDATNHRFGPNPQDIYNIGPRTSTEVIASFVPQARVVKAFNHAPISALRDIAQYSADDRKALFLSGDDTDAKRLVAAVIRDIGAEPIDVGNLRNGGMLQDTGRPLAGHGRLLSVKEAQQLFESLSHGSPNR